MSDDGCMTLMVLGGVALICAFFFGLFLGRNDAVEASANAALEARATAMAATTQITDFHTDHAINSVYEYAPPERPNLRCYMLDSSISKGWSCVILPPVPVDYCSESP